MKRHAAKRLRQAERMNRTIKDAAVKVYHDEDLESLRPHALAFVTA